MGGIPSRSTVCATVNPRGGGLDDFANIQSAVSGCTSGQVVQLGSATCAPTCAFVVHMADLPIYVNKGITVRGYGAACNNGSSPYCQASITVSDGLTAYTGGVCSGGTCSSQPVFFVSPTQTNTSDVGWAQCGGPGAPGSTGVGCGAVAVAADGVQGQTTIQVAQTSAWTVGRVVLIDETSNSGWQTDPISFSSMCGSVWAAPEWLSSSPYPVVNRVMYSKGMSCSWGGWDYPNTPTNYLPVTLGTVGCRYDFCDRITAELHQISAIGAGPCPGVNCTLTFDSPLTVGFRTDANHAAQVYDGPYNQAGNFFLGMLAQAGVENLSISRSPSGGVTLSFCQYCWVKNVEMTAWTGGSLNMSYCFRCQIDTIIVTDIWYSINNGAEYPIACDSATTETLLVNSIVNSAGKGMVARGGCAGSVVAYNYFDAIHYDSWSGIGDYWHDMSANASHLTGPHHVLFEGNRANNCDNDHTHGNNSYLTYFANHCVGYRTTFNDPSNSNLTVNDTTNTGYACGTTGPGGCVLNGSTGPQRAAGPTAWNYWHAFAFNVLGNSGVTTTGNGWTYAGDWTGKRMWMSGWEDGAGGLDPNLSSGTYMFRHGNYDYVTASIADYATGYSHTMPRSLYLAARPSFLGPGATCTYPWPWVTPTSGTQIQLNSCSGSGLPAKARWDAGTPFAQP